MSRQSICIPSTNFNADKLVISEVKELKIKGNIKMKIAEILYKNDKKQTKTIDGLELIKKYGELTPMIHIKSLYFGNHGGSSDFNCSIQINIIKAIFLEKQNIIPDFVFNETDSEEETEEVEEEEY